MANEQVLVRLAVGVAVVCDERFAVTSLPGFRVRQAGDPAQAARLRSVDVLRAQKMCADSQVVLGAVEGGLHQ